MRWTKSIKAKLLRLPKGERERVGYIKSNNQIVECDNVAADPTQAFKLTDQDLLNLSNKASATWHTHPGRSALLSDADVVGFKNFPDLIHIIIGEDGIRAYQVENGMVLELDGI